MHWITFLCHAQRLRRVVLRRALQERRQRESILLMQIIETAAIFKEEQLFTNTYVLRVIGILYSKILTKLVVAHVICSYTQGYTCNPCLIVRIML